MRYNNPIVSKRAIPPPARDDLPISPRRRNPNPSLLSSDQQMVRRSMFLDWELDDLLFWESLKTGQPESAIVRHALRCHFGLDD